MYYDGDYKPLTSEICDLIHKLSSAKEFTIVINTLNEHIAKIKLDKKNELTDLEKIPPFSV